jgi:hypothetical protein
MPDMSEQYNRDLIAAIKRLINEALQFWRPDLRQSTGVLPPTQLPPAGGSGGSGTRGGVVLSDDNPEDVGTADPGGSSNVSRGDHVHGHGSQAGGSQHSVATTSVAGFQSAADKAKEDAYPAISGLTTGHVLTATGASTVAFQAPAAGVSALDDLTDVAITSATLADRLRYDGSVWRNSALIWRPLMALDPTTGNYVVVTASGNAVMVEA